MGQGQGPEGAEVGMGRGALCSCPFSGSSSLMKFWSPDTRLARALWTLRGHSGACSWSKVIHRASGLLGEFIFKAALESLLVREGSVCLTLGCLPFSPQTERKRERESCRAGVRGRKEPGCWLPGRLHQPETRGISLRTPE